MSSITTQSGMRDYIKYNLGYPVINVEIADEQLNIIIEDCCQIFSRYMIGEGAETDYIIFTTCANISDYPVSAIWNSYTSAYLDNVQEVYDFGVQIGLDGLNLMFTPTHILLHDQWVVQGAYPGGTQGAIGVNDGLTMTNYNIAQMYIKEISKTFGKQFTLKYIPGKDIIRVIPTPSGAYTGVLVVNRKLDDTYLYNNPIVKKLCKGKAKMLWGRFILGKYGGNLPDGLTINATEIHEEGKTEYGEAMDDIKGEHPPCDFFIG